MAAKYMAAPAAMEMGSAGNACWKTGRSARVAHRPESTAAAQLAVAATPLAVRAKHARSLGGALQGSGAPVTRGDPS